MGFRSTMISEDYHREIPEWFVSKWDNIHCHIRIPIDAFGNPTNEGRPYFSFPISTLKERKFYAEFEREELFLDIQKVLKELKIKNICVVLLHECGGITKVVISEDKIEGMEPIEWKKVESVTHDYCYGCSDVKNIVQSEK